MMGPGDAVWRLKRNLQREGFEKGAGDGERLSVAQTFYGVFTCFYGKVRSRTGSNLQISTVV